MVTIQGVRMTDEAADVAIAAGVEPRYDVESIRDGFEDAESLLACCLDGADDELRDAWQEYVDAVVRRAAELDAIDHADRAADDDIATRMSFR